MSGGSQGKDCREGRKAIMTDINKKRQQCSNNKINLELQQTSHDTLEQRPGEGGRYAGKTKVQMH